MDWVSACSALLLGGEETSLRNFKNMDLKKIIIIKKKSTQVDSKDKKNMLNLTATQHITRGKAGN